MYVIPFTIVVALFAGDIGNDIFYFVNVFSESYYGYTVQLICTCWQERIY